MTEDTVQVYLKLFFNAINSLTPVKRQFALLLESFRFHKGQFVESYEVEVMFSAGKEVVKHLLEKANVRCVPRKSQRSVLFFIKIPPFPVVLIINRLLITINTLQMGVFIHYLT